MLTVILIKSDAAHLFNQKEMSLHDFIMGTASLENGESFEVELLNPQHAPFYKVTYNPTLDGVFDDFLLQRFKELRKQKHLDKASYDVFVKWVKASCSEAISPSGQAASPVPLKKKKQTIAKPQRMVTVTKKKSALSKRRKWPSIFHRLKEARKKLSHRKPSRRFIIWSVSFLLLLGITVGGGVTIAYFTQEKNKTETKEVKTSSFNQLLENKSYKKMYSEYPKQFWSWEETCVKELDSKSLIAAYEAVEDLSIAYDLAFVEEAYDKVVTLYESDAASIELNAMRMDFAAYSYLQLGDLTKAEETATSETSSVFYESLGWAYLAKGDVDKANDAAEEANSKELTQQIKDYQLVETTLQEVKKQLARKGLSSDLRKELEQSQRDLEAQLETLKKKPREESEAI
ncbi:tetratricopeptide repeat protein [Listeria monocytogenes]|uniref:tetratricopeptide repeat protein n=1 Tax=Listeria monocytogenes TaxID=1639 RepID=UPI001E563676|nr:hypothetical protein [Listeria monocytogenes]MCD2228812.1 hypothetical protein [Listeria monocytogenes]MCD2237634.1 hypothetical protein [Listeria monocytogenes]